MDFNRFCDLTHDILSQYYQRVARLQQDENVIFPKPVLYPSMMIAHRFREHHLAEFVGLSRQLNEIKLIKLGKSDADDYFHLTDEPLTGSTFTQKSSPVNTPTAPITFANLAFCQDANFVEIRKRFPIVDTMR
jgi:hypothetical protein